MTIFFGKISNKYDTNQITEGFYKAPKGSSWFGDIEIGDYTFLVGGDKIQLWKAREWGKHNNVECLWFDIINNDLRIKTNRLSALKFFKLTTDLIIHSSRTAKNRCFFKLDVIKGFNIEDLAKTSFYKNNELYRKIIIYKNQDLVEPNLEDLQFYFSENKLYLHPNSFTEEKVITSFKDNFKYVGKGSTNKDKIMSRILNSDHQTTTFSYNQISMRSIYDTFFCKYEEKLKYYLVGAFWENWNPEDQTSIFLKNSIWENGYDDRFINEVNSVTNNSKIAIKTIDRKGDKMYIKAMGTVMKNHKNGKLLDVQWEEEFDEFKLDFSGGYWKTIHEVKNKEHINAIWENKESRTMEKKTNNTPLNQILFGPPGTGKTYETIKKAVEIINPDFSNSNNRESIKKEYDRLIEKGLIVFTTFHQSMSYEDFIEGIKPEVNEKDEITYTVKNGVFKELCKEASKRNSTIKSSSFDERFQKLKDEWEESDNSELVIEMTKSEFTITKISNNNISFNKKSGSNKHDLVISTLKELYEEKRIMKSGLASYYYPIIDKLKSYQIESKNNDIDNFVLIIDEINRGNVSAIFGELITLIENTKRSGDGNLEALTAKLPYSKEDFTIPNNLYIIGTMNTADRSVEALDTALRRRFYFEEKMPNYELPELETDLDIDLKTLLKTINKRIEILLDREHQIGHSYLLNIKNEKQLLDTFQNKIIPLLQEYFYNDYEKIRLVIGDNFITKENTKIEFAVKNNDYETNSIYTWKELNENNIIDNVTSIYSTQTSNE